MRSRESGAVEGGHPAAVAVHPDLNAAGIQRAGCRQELGAELEEIVRFVVHQVVVARVAVMAPRLPALQQPRDLPD